MNKSIIFSRQLFGILIFLHFSFCSFTQENHVFDPISPIGHPMVLAGSFGELRSNHFHAGIDIKPFKWNKEGDKIFAVEDGFISRIKVQGGGYGNALYIDHPGGYTTVYAHLLRFTDSISEYVRQHQFLNKSFEVDIYPEENSFPVKKGDLISWMGNSGRSHGAHLHFEIRNTITEVPINPYHFGIGPDDKRQPIFSWLKVSHMLPDSTEVDADVFKTNRVRSGIYRLEKDTVEINAWRVGIEFNGFDQMNGAPNKNGIYELIMKLNDEPVYAYKLDSISFEESRHLNAHINYASYAETKRKYQRCYRLAANPLSIYVDSFKNASIFPIYAEKAQQVEIIAKDLAGNLSKLKFWLKRKKEMSPPPPLHYNYILEEGEGHIIKFEDHIIFFPDTSLYQKSYINLSTSKSIDPPMASEQIFLKTQGHIFKDWIDIFINSKNIADSLLDKTVIVDCSGSDLLSYGGDKFEDFITAKILKFGSYALFTDTIPPEIKALNFKYDMSGIKSMHFEIKDNLKIGGKLPSLKYDAYIDGEWVLFEFDAKSNRISYPDLNNLERGIHVLRIEVQDERKNISIFEDKFIIK